MGNINVKPNSTFNALEECGTLAVPRGVKF
jgi:hypothetical protein